MSWTSWTGIFGGMTAFLISTAATAFWTVVGKHVVCWLEQYFCWVLTLAYSYSLKVITPYAALVPAMPPLAMDVMVQPFLIFNYYFPLAEVLVACFLVFLLVAVLRLVRFIKQFVPTVAN